MKSGQATDSQKLEITKLQLEQARKRVGELEKEIINLRNKQ